MTNVNDDTKLIITPTDMSRADGVRRFTNSEIQTFKRCRRKWYFAYYRKLIPVQASFVGVMQIGNRIHKALQYHYGTQIPGSTQHIDASTALEHLIEHDRDAMLEHHIEDDDVVEQFSVEADLERVMMRGYLEWLAETGDDANYTIIAAEDYREAQIRCFVRGVTHYVKIIARLDLRVQRDSDGAILFLDHKTTNSFETLMRALPMNEQMLWYILIEYISEEKNHVNGALYNMIRRTKRTARAKPPFYARYSVYHNETELLAFLMRTQGVIGSIIEATNGLDMDIDHRLVAYPTPTNDCTWSCPFYTACKLTDDGSYAEGLLRNNFYVGDPLHYYASDDMRIIDHD